MSEREKEGGRERERGGEKEREGEREISANLTGHREWRVGGWMYGWVNWLNRPMLKYMDV